MGVHYNHFQDNAYKLYNLRIENYKDRVAVFGETSITKDLKGLHKAEEIERYFSDLADCMREMKGRGELTKPIEKTPPIKKDNPFLP